MKYINNTELEGCPAKSITIIKKDGKLIIAGYYFNQIELTRKEKEMILKTVGDDGWSEYQRRGAQAPFPLPSPLRVTYRKPHGGDLLRNKFYKNIFFREKKT